MPSTDYTIFKSIAFKRSGNGIPTLFLHGFLMSSSIFDDIISSLKMDALQIDLPAHGQAPKLEVFQSIDETAHHINQLLDFLHIDQIDIVAHSMGAYVAMALASLNSNVINSLFIMNATPAKDSEARLLMRNKEIALIQNGKKSILLKAHLMHIFALQNHNLVERYEVPLVDMFNKVDEKSMIYTIQAMAQRSEHYQTIQKLECPIRFYFGENDLLLSPQNALERLMFFFNNQIALFKTNADENGSTKYVNNNITLSIIEDCGHLPFIEQQLLIKSELLKCLKKR